MSVSPWRVVNTDLLPEAQTYGMLVNTHWVLPVSEGGASAAGGAGAVAVDEFNLSGRRRRSLVRGVSAG